MSEATERPARRTRGVHADQVRAVVRQRLADGTYKLGSHMPPQRALAAELGASYGLIAKALQPFKDAGVLQALGPGGTVVVGRIEAAGPHDQVVGRRVLQLAERSEGIENMRRVIRERVTGGQYGAGSRLPSQRKLCREFEVSEHVVRAALAPLRAEGILSFVRGQGLYVVDPKEGPRKGRAGIEHTVRQRIADGTYPPLTWMPRLQALGDEYGVSAQTVSIALAPLRAEKLLGTARGSMCYVIDPANPTAQPDTPAPYRRQNTPGWTGSVPTPRPAAPPPGEPGNAPPVTPEKEG
ncbi:GntR family transcriptional regulator [Streptomyces sp. SD11]